MDDFQNYIRNLPLRSGHPKTKQICLMHFICFMINKIPNDQSITEQGSVRKFFILVNIRSNFEPSCDLDKPARRILDVLHSLQLSFLPFGNCDAITPVRVL